MQPGANGSLAAKPPKRAEGAQGGLLESVVDQIGITQHAEGQQSQASLVHQEEVDEGVAVPPSRCLELPVALHGLCHQASLPPPTAVRRCNARLESLSQRCHAVPSRP